MLKAWQVAWLFVLFLFIFITRPGSQRTQGLWEINLGYWWPGWFSYIIISICCHYHIDVLVFIHLFSSSILCSINFSVLRTIILVDVAMNSLLLVASVLLVQNELNSNNDGTISFRCFFWSRIWGFRVTLMSSLVYSYFIKEIFRLSVVLLWWC